MRKDTATFVVTAEDIAAAGAAIEDGKPPSKVCPVAQALMRLGVSFADPGDGVSAYAWCSRDELHENPQAISRWIDTFDDGEPVEPQTFTVPDSWLPKGGAR